MREQSYAEGPCVVVQDTTQNFTSYEEAEEQGIHMRHQWWHLGLRPRQAKDTCAMNEALAEDQEWFGDGPQLTDEMWEKYERERMAILERTREDSTPRAIIDSEGHFAAHSSLRIISLGQNNAAALPQKDDDWE